MAYGSTSMNRATAILLALLPLACGSSSGGGAPSPDSGVSDAVADVGLPDGGTESGPAGYPASHPPMPQVQNLGGPVMKSPKLVIITFAGDPLAPSIDDFVAKVAASATYWSGTTAEYGVGPVASVVDLSVAETPPSSLMDSDVQTWLTTKLSPPDGGTPDAGAAWPQPDGETLYMIYYPDGVTVSQGGGTSCNEFYGYHGDYALSSTTYVSYSVVARCPPFPTTSAIDSIAAVASHELVEAVTDPLVQDHPAYAEPDVDHVAWASLAGGELGDMCAGFGNVFYKPTDVPYLVQRTWSNKAAAASLDPCQPDGATPNFNAAAMLNDAVKVVVDSSSFTTKGVTIPVGGTKTVELDLFSSAETSGPFTVQAYDAASYVSMGGSPAELDVSFAGKTTATGQNGDTLELTVKVLKADPSGGEMFLLVSTLGSGANAVQTYWVGLVGN